MDLSWYNTLNKPFFTPPSWLFGPAWTVLYILIAVSAILIFRQGIKKVKVKEALKLFGVQLALNLIWSPVFFGLHNIFLSLVIIAVLLYLILLTIQAFSKIDKTASYLLWPYLAWVGYATVLNFSIWIMNL